MGSVFAKKQQKKQIEEPLQKQEKETTPPLTQEFLDEMFLRLEQSLKDKPSEFKDSEKLSKSRFKIIPIQKLDQRKLHTQKPIQGRQIWSSKGRIQYYQESCHLSYHDQNGFMQAFCEAYMEHGDVKITPDDVWLAIMFFFSKYINDHAQQLRKALVNHEGQKELTVVTFQGDRNWEKFLEKIIILIKKNSVTGVAENLECDFTSTDNFSRLLSTAMIMSTFKKFFRYTNYVIGCGIQNVHMGGCLQDWQHLSQKLAYLRQFDVNGQMKVYVDNLLPVLRQFEQTYKGNPSVEFWNNIYQKRQYPPTLYQPSQIITGWIIRFFTTSPRLQKKVEMQSIKVPIKRVCAQTQEAKMLALLGGCKGVSVSDQKVYRPHFSFAIVEERVPLQEHPQLNDI